MSTFIIYDVLMEDHGANPTSMLDHEYFNGVPGSVITTRSGAGPVTSVKLPSGFEFFLSTTYKGYLDLAGSPYTY
jgi:hypothetical protein